MTISKRGEIEVELDGETLVLVFKYETLMSIEENMGGRVSIDELFLSGTISRTALAEAVRCGLEKRYRKKTRRQVAQMIGRTVDVDEKAYGAISLAVVKGILIANGASKDQIDELDRQIDQDLEEQGVESLKKEIADSDDPTKSQPVALTTTGSPERLLSSG